MKWEMPIVVHGSCVEFWAPGGQDSAYFCREDFMRAVRLSNLPCYTARTGTFVVSTVKMPKSHPIWVGRRHTSMGGGVTLNWATSKPMDVYGLGGALRTAAETDLMRLMQGHKRDLFRLDRVVPLYCQVRWDSAT
jgi:hypothetical protein